MYLILSLVALALFIAGVFRALDRDWVPAIFFWIAAALVGPGGISLFL